jgi:hypothetical protein
MEFMRWLCRRRGHWTRLDVAEHEICRRCNSLVSTPYSRAARPAPAADA